MSMCLVLMFLHLSTYNRVLVDALIIGVYFHLIEVLLGLRIRVECHVPDDVFCSSE